MTDRLDVELKATATSDGEIEGFASIFDAAPDAVGDVVAKGAFRRSLREHKAAGRLPAMLWGHDPHEPIGRWTEITETDQGLRVKGKLTLGVQRAAELRALLLDDAISGLSIGYRTKSFERRGNGRRLTDLDLIETSLVVLPCAPGARVHAVKGAAMDDDVTIDTNPPEPVTELAERITGIENKMAALTQIADLSTRIDKVETRLARPGATRVEVKDDPEIEVKAFSSWCRKGWDGIGDIERKVLTATAIGSPATEGWQTVPQQFVAELMRNLVEASPIRQVARVMQVSGTPVILPQRLTNLVASWVGETAEHALSEPTYDQISVPVYEARVSTEVSNQLLEDSAFNIAQELAFDFGEAFGLLEGTSFVSGSGVGGPEGFLEADAFTSLTATGITADNLIDLYHSIPSRYAARGTWLLRRETIGAIRKLRSAVDGPYIWIDSLRPGDPAQLLGRPALEVPDLAVAGSSPVVTCVAFGDWARAFRIVDRVGLEILRDPYSAARRSIVTFHARRRTGGQLVDAGAVKGLLA